MSSYYQKPSDTQPLLDVETGQDRLERQRTLKKLYCFLLALACIGLIIGYFSPTGKCGDT